MRTFMFGISVAEQEVGQLMLAVGNCLMLDRTTPPFDYDEYVGIGGTKIERRFVFEAHVPEDEVLDFLEKINLQTSQTVHIGTRRPEKLAAAA